VSKDTGPRAGARGLRGDGAARDIANANSIRAQDGVRLMPVVDLR